MKIFRLTSRIREYEHIVHTYIRVYAHVNAYETEAKTEIAKTSAPKQKNCQQHIQWMAVQNECEWEAKRYKNGRSKNKHPKKQQKQKKKTKKNKLREYTIVYK